MKKSCLIFVMCFTLFLSACSNKRTEEYKKQYFSEKDTFIKMSEIVIRHYKTNDLEDGFSIWCGDSETNVFYDTEPNPTINYTLTQNELDDIFNFISKSRYEYVSIDEKFVEFGNSTGSVFMYYCLTEEKPKKLSRNHNLYDFGDGWYFSISITR